jgi:alkylmercury lyase
MSTDDSARQAGCRGAGQGGNDIVRIGAWWDLQKEQFPGFELVPHLARLLAEEGRPVTLDRIATAASRKVEEVDALLHQHPGVDWDEDGRLVGFGLTLRPTPHRFSFDGHTVYGFCASDTLDFPVMLGRSGVIESSCPRTGQVIQVEVTPEQVISVDPATAVVSLVRPERFRDIRTEGCDLGWFFASEEAASEWRAAHPEGMIHSVEEEFKQTREMMFRVGWAAAAEGRR